MAKKKAKPKAEYLPKDWKPTQAVDDPIINSPYVEPNQHWLYREGTPELIDERRPASYFYKEKRTGRREEQLFDELEREENRDDLPLVNALRDDVRRWRESGYRGAERVTRELLSYWMREDRPRRLFYCQRESVETIIYLLEFAIPNRLGATGFRSFKVDADNFKKLFVGEKPNFETLVDSDFFPRLVDQPADENSIPLRRLGCKMATGSGKTIVMAMLIAWAFCNRGRNPNSRQFPNAVLVCAPNLTVRNRLQVLKPEDPDNYYDEFDIVPSRYREYLNRGKVLVTNWHKFSPKSEHVENGKSYKVVNKGEETNDAFTLDRLGELANRLPIMVLNDEGHHCWRPKPNFTEKEEKAAVKGLSRDEKDALKADAEEARVWLAGLDRMNNCGLLGNDDKGNPVPGVMACVDLSATPFYLGNSGYPEGSPFPWLVSDFGLVDAIECGITKVPRLPVKDDTGQKDDAGRPDPKYFRLWENIKADCSTSERIKNQPKTEAVYKYAQDALLTLASQWKVQFEKYKESAGGESFIPPVLIVVCDNTDIAQLVYEKISGETEEEIVDPDNPKKKITVTRYGKGEIFSDLLANTEKQQNTFRIDSKLLAKLDAEEGETKDETILKMREIIDTVGKRGGLGEQIRCVVSVSMLTEGWDANNVTHILGIRAFQSQLLCEQVVGRGLRRMSYIPDPETGLLPAEYVDVYGIPFSLIPYKGKPKETEPKPDPVYHPIFALEERKDFEIRLPNVESYVYELREQGIKADIEKMEPLKVDDAPAEVYVRAPKGYQEDTSHDRDMEGLIVHTRKEYYETVRPQQVVFQLANDVLEELMTGVTENGDKRAELRLRARHQLFPELVGIVQRYIKEKVTFREGLDHRELKLERYRRFVVERIRDNILPAASEKGKLIPILNRFRPYNSTADVNYQTTRPVVSLTKSHLNRAMLQSGAESGGYEAGAIEVFEELDCVECYTPNDKQVGLVVPYDYDGETKTYEPDFVVRLRGGIILMLEIKGAKGRLHDQNLVPAKNAAAKKWCEAVSNLGKYGQWVFDIYDDELTEGTLREMLLRYAKDPEDLPFEFVDPSKGKIWEDCVPLTSLRTVATKSNATQKQLADGTWDSDLIRWEGHPKFKKGMFVAKVHGSAMEPGIPAYSYCLFEPCSDLESSDKPALVSHPGISDPHAGGNWTLRTVEYVEPVSDDKDWVHQRVVLRPTSFDYALITVDLQKDEKLEILGQFVCVLDSSVFS
jgi:type III restriction enzyme